MTKIYTAIGLMSGTSVDGIDASIIQSDGEDKLRVLNNDFTAYDKKIISEIKDLKEKINSKKDIETNKNLILKIEKDITNLHANAVEKILKKTTTKIDLVGFHGQTIYHNFNEKISKQLGDGELLSKKINLDIIYNFRENDIRNGGQGAPLTPIYHKLLRKKLNIELPILFINIGGISNLTYISKDEKIISFDSGPGNCLVDEFLQLKSKNKIIYDKDGEIAMRGKCNDIILENYLNNNYFNLQPPKSLDVKDFSLSMIRGLSVDEAVSTLSEFTVRTIVDGLNFFKEKPKKIILMGGGRKNNYFFENISKKSKIKTIDINDLTYDGDFIESQAFAYLGIRSKLKKNISYPETTGVTKPCTGGLMIKIK